MNSDYRLYESYIGKKENYRLYGIYILGKTGGLKKVKKKVMVKKNIVKGKHIFARKSKTCNGSGQAGCDRFD